MAIPTIAKPIAVMGIGVVIAGVALSTYRMNRASLRAQPGQPRSAFVVEAAGAATLVIVDHVQTAHTSATAIGDRIAAIDVETGAPTAARIEDEQLACWRAAGARVWCASADGVALLAIPSLEPIARSTDLVRASGRDAPIADHFARAGADVQLLLPGGRGVVIDSGSLAVTETDRPEDAAVSDEVACPSSISTGDGFVTLRDGGGGGAGGGVAGSAHLAAAITRLDGHGHVRWEAKIPDERCMSATLIGKRLVVSTYDAAHRAYALDADTGRLLWAFAF